MNKITNPDRTSLTSGRVLARNTVVNLIGQGVPLLVAIFTIPLIVEGLGTDRFGILALAWMVVGYFSLFDLGTGRATTKFVADHIACGESSALPQLVWTSLAMLFCLGLLGAFLLAAVSPLLVSSVLKIPSHLRDETLKSFFVLAAAIPLVLGTAGARGVLEAHQRFGLINAIKVPVSIATYAAPLLVLPFSHSLYPVTAVLLLSRLVECMAYLYLCVQAIPGMKRPQRPNIVYVNKLLGFGGWLTVTNIVGPFMASMDRFVIGSMLTMSAVAYYATPYDLVTRLWIISGSVLGVMFPAFCASSVTDFNRFTLLYEKAIIYIVLVLAPIILIVIVLANPLLEVWLGHEFAMQSTLVLQILAVGVLINSISQGPYTAIQAMGRPDITAKLHLMELPLYLVGLWFFVRHAGIAGAAFAWLLRIVIDTVMLFYFAVRMAPESVDTVKKVTLALVMMIGFGAWTAQVHAVHLKIACLVTTVVFLEAGAWILLVRQQDRAVLRNGLREILNHHVLKRGGKP